jgi:hypothetical protein
MAAKDKWLGEDCPTAQRLRQLQALSGQQTNVGFAKFLGISAPRLNNLLKGAPIGKEVAFTIVQKIPGITLDWIWFGKPDGLPLQLARKLDAVPGGAGKARTTRP